MSLRTSLVYRYQSLATALGLGNHGFFVKYSYARTMPRNIPSYSAVERLFEGKRSDYEAMIAEFGGLGDEIDAAVTAGAFPWERPGMFPRLDVVTTYGMIRHLKPKRILEIGSGTSSHVMRAALDANGTGALTCIDPEPRTDVSALDVTFHKRILSEDDGALLADFEPNDVLFIDSSHVMAPGMDVDIQFNRMFPELKSGAIVHVHDIFLPDGYPDRWYTRYYSEQNALIGWIMSGYFEVIFPGYYAATRLESAWDAALADYKPASMTTKSGSIWLRRL